MRKFSRLFDIFAAVWIAGCLTVLLAYGLWSLDRGLDLTDESYYLTAAINPDAIILWATAMHWLTAELWRLTGSLVGFRGMGLGILAVSSMILALGSVRAFRGIGIEIRGGPVLMVAACSLIGAMLYHAFVAFAPSYNLLAVTGAYMAVGLAGLAAGRPLGFRLYGLQLLAGAALGVAFIAKFSSGVSVWAVVCAIAVVLGGSLRERVQAIGLITGGMAAVITGAVLLHTTFSEALAQFRLGALVYMLGANETFPVRLVRYFNETAQFLKLLCAGFGIPILLFGIYAVRPRLWIALLGLAAFAYALVADDYLLGGMDRHRVQTVPLMAAVILSLLATARLWLKSPKAVCLLGVLVLLPFCTSIGTYNPLHTQILFSLAPWGVVAGLLAFGLSAPSGSQYAAMLACLLFVTVVSSQVVTNGLRMPYRLYRPLPDQSEAITIPPLGTFRVDRETRDSYLKLIRLADACGIKPGQGFLGLYNIPGVALITQTVTLGMPILQDRPSTEPILDQLTPEVIRSAVVGIDLDSGSYDPSMPKQLAAFPAGYRSCGTVILPFDQQRLDLWVGEGGG